LLGETHAVGINSAGQIVGSYSDGSHLHGYLYSGGNYTILDDPLAIQDSTSSYGTVANGINDKGQVVGYFLGSDHRFHGFLYSGGNYTTLDESTSASVSTYAWGINNSGQIAGWYVNGSGGENAQGFIATPATPTSSIVEGSILTATPSLGTDSDNTAANVTYQWQSNNGSGWNNINGATGSTYVVAETVEGSQIQAVASFTDDTGRTVTATSAPTGVGMRRPRSRHR
jgi:probable HAF family extracellular repeat protein